MFRNFLSDNFRRHPKYGARWLRRFQLSFVPVRLDRCQAKVPDLDRPFLEVMLVIVVVFKVDRLHPVELELGSALVSRLLIGNEKDVIRLQISVQDVAAVQIRHARGGLFGYVDQLAYVPVHFFDVQVTIEAGSGAPFGHDRQIWFKDTADEEENVVVSGKLQDDDLVFECFSLGGSWRLNVEELDRDFSVVEIFSLMNNPEGALANFMVEVDIYLTERYFPRYERVTTRGQL